MSDFVHKVRLLEAVEQEDINQVRLALSQNQDVDTRNKFGMNALQIAVEKQNLDIVLLLLKHGTNVNSACTNVDVMPYGMYKGYTALHFSAVKGDVAIVKELLSVGADVNAQEFNGNRSPLHIAVENGFVNVVELLLQYKPIIKLQDKLGNTVLHIACIKKDLRTVNMLLKNGAEINVMNNNHYTPLQYAALHSHEQMIKTLISYNGIANTRSCVKIRSLLLACREHKVRAISGLLVCDCPFDFSNINSFAALRYAIVNGCGITVELLLLAGADVNYVSSSGDTILHFACRMVNEEIIQLLIQHGSSVNVTNDVGDTPLHCASKNNCSGVVDTLIKFGGNINIRNNAGEMPLMTGFAYEFTDTIKKLMMYSSDFDIRDEMNNTLIHLASKLPDSEVLELLVQENLNVNTINDYGDLPLHVACNNNRLCNAKCLIANGSKIDECNDEGFSPLYFAITNGCSELVGLLLSHCCDVSYTDEYGNTPLHLACEIGSTDTIRKLIEHGCPVNAENCDGYMPLHYAIKCGITEPVELLLKSGADVNTESERGEITFMMGFEFGTLKIMKLLLEYEPDLFVRDSNNYTLLHYAASYADSEVVKIVLNSCIDIDAVGNDGKTALHLACERDLPNIVSLLLNHGCDINKSETIIDLYIEDSNKNTVVSIMEHLIKLHVAGIYISPAFDKLFHLEPVVMFFNFMSFSYACKFDLEIIKSAKLGNTSYTWYHILVKSLNKVTILLRNPEVVNALQSGMEDELLVYKKYIDCKIHQAFFRKSLIEKCINHFYTMFSSLPVLPMYCVDMILGHLSNHDLNAIVTIFSTKL